MRFCANVSVCRHALPSAPLFESALALLISLARSFLGGWGLRFIMTFVIFVSTLVFMIRTPQPVAAISSDFG